MPARSRLLYTLDRPSKFGRERALAYLRWPHEQVGVGKTAVIQRALKESHNSFMAYNIPSLKRAAFYLQDPILSLSLAKRVIFYHSLDRSKKTSRPILSNRTARPMLGK